MVIPVKQYQKNYIIFFLMIFDNFMTPTRAKPRVKAMFLIFCSHLPLTCLLEDSVLSKDFIETYYNGNILTICSLSVLSECFMKIHFNNVLTICSPRHDLETPFKNQFFSIFSKSKYAMKKQFSQKSSGNPTL